LAAPLDQDGARGSGGHHLAASGLFMFAERGVVEAVPFVGEKAQGGDRAAVGLETLDDGADGAFVGGAGQCVGVAERG